ncbi:glutamate racemase [Blattabacterium cuenoti]|uniref:glutamate racemase n=1 Tax=Blattabacterium cuenoti TaxID=1653831 RepID=UPI00163C9A5C|nr:glutamate racemase [Blattabacterium cuenoti]
MHKYASNCFSNKEPIGIFDSGIGGLIIAKEIKIHMPNETLIYYGDTKNMPYGNKSRDFIIENSMKMVAFFYEKKCKAIVIACNSITSNALEIIKDKFKRKILIFDVINPVIKNNIFLSFKKIGIIATPATIYSNFYEEKIRSYYNHLNIFSLSIPSLALLIEKGTDMKIIKFFLKNYLNRIQSIDAILLACTHYLFLKKEIEHFYHGKVYLIDIPRIVVQEIKNKLEEKGLLCIHPSWNNYNIFYTSSSISNFFEKKVRSLFRNNIFIKRTLI